MKLINLGEEKARKEGITTPNKVIGEVGEWVKQEDVKHIICIVQTSKDTVSLYNSTMENVKTIGLLDCGKQLILDDMFYSD